MDRDDSLDENAPETGAQTNLEQTDEQPLSGAIPSDAGDDAQDLVARQESDATDDADRVEPDDVLLKPAGDGMPAEFEAPRAPAAQGPVDEPEQPDASVSSDDVAAGHVVGEDDSTDADEPAAEQASPVAAVDDASAEQGEGDDDEGGDEDEDDTSESSDDTSESSDDTSDDTSDDEDDEGDSDVATQPAGASEETDEAVEVDSELAAAVEEVFENADIPADGDDDADEDLEDEVPGEWFVVHTYAGYENKVKANLETRIVSMNMEDAIYEVVIPMEKVTEMKNGKKTTVDRKVFPGYLLVRMEQNDDSWYVVRNTPGVTGFVGSGSKPIPLSEREVDKILQRKTGPEEAAAARPRPEWQVNDPVRVTTGPFANFQGVVSDIDLERAKLKVLVNIFGRETPVELGFDQVAKV